MTYRRSIATLVAPRYAMSRLLPIALAGAVGALGVATSTEARITKIQITASESPTFGGYSWSGVGQYEKIVGKAFGEIDPNDPKNAVIVDIQLAPRNASGHVEYAIDFYILKPIDLAKGNHRVFHEAPNRGTKLFGAYFNRMPTAGNDPASAANPQTGFLMQYGYTMAWNGWDFAAGTSTANFNSTIAVPIAKNADGSSITGPSYEYIEFDNATSATYTLTYPAATLDQSKAVLTTRVHLDDAPQVVPAAGWQYGNNGTTISLLPAGTLFKQGNIYEFSYAAKDPTVNGIGFAAERDFNSFLRYAVADDLGTANPLARDVQKVYAFEVSQPARMMNDFVHLGFNQDELGRVVFDGNLNYIGAGDGIHLNTRFSQPNRTERNRQHHLYAEGVFPFANQTLTDPISGKTDGRFARCSNSGTCPRAVEVYSSNEYWVKAGSLMTTDPMGTVDLTDPTYARYYLVSSFQHGLGNGNSKGVCQQLQNPLDAGPVLRSLLVALDAWSTNGTAPPPSQVPKLADGTLVPPDQKSVGFPSIPGVLYTGLKTTRYLLNYGPNYYATGIMTINPPLITPPYQDNPANGPIYPSFVPKTDKDGNEIAGVRLPDVTVPIATYTGWGLRDAAFGGPDGCESTGQMIPFAKTATDRAASGDPRLSIAERYPNFSGYYFQLVNTINNFVANRWMLPEDANPALIRLLQAGLSTGAIKLQTKNDWKLMEKAATMEFRVPASDFLEIGDREPTFE